MSPDDAIRFAIASVELEGYVVDDHLRLMIAKVAHGDMTTEEALELRKTYLEREREAEKRLEAAEKGIRIKQHLEEQGML